MRKSLFIFTLALPMISQAGLEFYCKTDNNKYAQLVEKDGVFTYKFGKNLKKPELVLRKTQDDYFIRTEKLDTRIGVVMAIRNGKYFYELREGEKLQGKDVKGRPVWQRFGSITVEKNDKTLAVINCIPSSIRTRSDNVSKLTSNRAKLSFPKTVS